MPPKAKPKWLQTPKKAQWVRRAPATTRLRVMRLLKIIAKKNMIIKRMGARNRALRVRMNRVKLEAAQAVKDEDENRAFDKKILEKMEDEMSTDTDPSDDTVED